MHSTLLLLVSVKTGLKHSCRRGITLKKLFLVEHNVLLLYSSGVCETLLKLIFLILLEIIFSYFFSGVCTFSFLSTRKAAPLISFIQ